MHSLIKVNMLPIVLLPFIAISITPVVECGSHFFQYANVPAWNAYEFGYNRGNQHHFTSRFEKKHGWTFKTKVRWGDKHGWGESYWDYNHGDDKKKGHEHKGWGHGHGHKGWDKHGSSSNLQESVLPARAGEMDVEEGPVIAQRMEDFPPPQQQQQQRQRQQIVPRGRRNRVTEEYRPRSEEYANSY